MEEINDVPINVSPLKIIQRDYIIMDELQNFYKCWPRDLCKIYLNKAYNTVNEYAENEYGDRYHLLARFCTIELELPYTDKPELVDLEKYFRKAARIWADIINSEKVSKVGSLGGIVCIPMSLYDKKNDVAVDEDLKPIFKSMGGGKKVFPEMGIDLVSNDDKIQLTIEDPHTEKENVVRRYMFHFTVFPYNIRDRKSWVSPKEMNEMYPWPVFADEGALSGFTFEQYDNMIAEKNKINETQ